MQRTCIFIICCIATIALALPVQDIKLVTQPKPGQEFVFVQSSESGAKPIARKEKTEVNVQHFETAHKIPPRLTFELNQQVDEESENVPIKPVKNVGKKVHKRHAAELPAPAPPGAIKLNVAQLLEKYKQAMKTSTAAPSSTTTESTTKSSRRRGTKRRSRRSPLSKISEPTTQSPVLTTSKIAPKSVDFDVVGSASEKQRSRIQIKKGPNGQEYEYEYVYYYYDDDEDAKDKKTTNAHDGPARNSISRNDKSREKATPEVNEVLPSRSKSRGRQLGEEESVKEERLPANTRSRNLNTTPVPEDEPKPSASRTRSRGRPAVETSTSATDEDNISDETQGSRGRTRANVRRPSLVDSETFNTHSASQPVAAQSPTFPAQLPAGPDEQEDKSESTKQPSAAPDDGEETSKPNQDESETTTTVTGMKKVALDLYAISQGTQKLFGEEGSELSTEEDKDYATTQDSSSTEEIETTTSTTTTTTTTTTPAPTTTRTTTTTTTTEAPTKASRFGGRRTALSGRKSTTTTTEAPVATETKPKKFGRPSFGGRARVKPTPAPVEEDVHKEESKPVSQSKPPGRARFGASRPRGRTTSTPEEVKEESSTAATITTNHKPSLPRSRPTFNSLRGRGRSTTAAPPAEEPASDSESSSSEPSSTTARPPRRIAGANTNIKPLRPGPRINIAGRRGAQTTTTTTETSSPEEDHQVTGDEEETHAEAASEKEEAPAPAPVDNSPLGRLRNKNRLNIQPKQKSGSAASASATVQVRRVNPLLNRRKLGQTTEAPSSEAPSSEATEPEEEPAAETEVSTSSSSTTEEPRGLNKLLAGRRRLAARVPGTINHK